MDNLEYIDSYFKGEMAAGEARQFDQKIQDDPAFAEEVAYYLSVLMAGKEQVAEEKKQRFREIYNQGVPAGETMAVIRKMSAWKTWKVAAAAAVLAGLVLGLYLMFRPMSPDQVADQYISEKLATLSVKMGVMDSVQNGLRLYNEGKYEEALQVFEGMLQTDPSNPTALEKAGIISLRLQRYDQALNYFRKLESLTNLRVNSGLFYEALTLMRRNKDGDGEKSKQLLQQVVENNLDMKQDAQALQKKL
ncbi:MAG TPA: tetratricopeptide repeat protein [Puia sp.]|nr:tetratricopeptide repeat protein [Puia sp.]